MNKFFPAGCFIFICLFSSCANKEPDQDPDLKSFMPIEKVAIDSTATVIAAPDSLPGVGTATMEALPQQVVTQNAAVTAPGMNPAHGQPNHRCDISVGAPLNSPATKPATQTVQTTTAVQPTATAQPKIVTAPGMNPPHGEPNHRCDIAVGAALNSAAAKPAAPTVTPVAVQGSKDTLR